MYVLASMCVSCCVLAWATFGGKGTVEFKHNLGYPWVRPRDPFVEKEPA
jgi:hypothetical protein